MATTLQQKAVLAGYPTQLAVIRACKRLGHSVHQPTLSAMYRGDDGYEKVRRALCALLWPGWSFAQAEPQLQKLINNSKSNGKQ